ncbi:MAG TPA: DUF2283 domain-containing protein [Candidatus Udaeobacter sp.]|nr:DUF2283 domain-containing protein [Candidatus Udaeobacter sp.]
MKRRKTPNIISGSTAWERSCLNPPTHGGTQTRSSRGDETDLRSASEYRLPALHEKTAEVETIQVSDSLNVDIAPDGTIYGIELLNANQQLGGDNGGHFVIVNEAAGKTEDIALEI